MMLIRSLRRRPTVHRRVDAGVKFLDRKLGRANWIGLIDLDTLNVYASSHCVVAQVTNSYYYLGARHLGLTPFGAKAERTRELGFHVYPNEFGGELNDAWHARLRELVSA